MKYYLHKILVKDENRRYTIKQYSIKEFKNFKSALEEFKKYINIQGDISTRNRIGKNYKYLFDIRISTSKRRLKIDLTSTLLTVLNVLTFKSPNTKYQCKREYLEIDKDLGSLVTSRIIMETNSKKACKEYIDTMKEYVNYENNYYVKEEGELLYSRYGNLI